MNSRMVVLLLTVLTLGSFAAFLSQRQSLQQTRQENSVLKEQLVSNGTSELLRLRREVARLREQRGTARDTSSPAPASVVSSSASTVPLSLSDAASSGKNQLDRLSQVRDTFRNLATGDASIALRDAKQMTNAVERETALLTLLSEWTGGQLGDPRRRARNIAEYGLEAGLGIELAKNPQLAQLWATEMTDGRGRFAVLRETASALLDSDPAASFALTEQLPEKDRRRFYDSILANWASSDTEAALRWVEQFAEPADREAGLATVRSVAPVGIGVMLNMRDGLPVISNLQEGSPAGASGQLRAGDRIVAVAQGGGSFTETRGMSMQNIVNLVRGEIGSTIHLQVLSEDEPAGQRARTISIIRDQIKYKR